MSVTVLDKTLEIDGIGLRYREAGEGKTIVFLHGAGGAPPLSASFVTMLAERHRVLVPSRPGFDETPVGSCKTLLDVVETMAHFIARIGDGKVHLVAQSAGGAIGCWLPILHPELVESLVLSAPAAFAGHRPTGSAPPSMEAIEKLLYGPHPVWDAPPSEAERQRIARNARENMARFTAPAGNSDLLARLPEIKVPTLLICGTDDRMIPAEAMLPYQQHIRGCIRIFIHGAAHEMPISAAHSWVKLVGEFVDRGEYFLVNMGEPSRAAT
jgi:pimeloyl-ACP methyl ester carboxylesterase